MVREKRAFDAADPSDGRRILVDRLWPRGLSKEMARMEWWLKEIAPSEELRRWFGHDPARWEEFRARYRGELQAQVQVLEELRELSRRERITLLYAAKDQKPSNAVALKEELGGD